MLSEAMIVNLAFVFLAGLLFMPAFRAISKILSGHSQKVGGELQASAKAYEEAKNKLENFLTNQEEFSRTLEEIIQSSIRESKLASEAVKAETEAAIEQYLNNAMAKMSNYSGTVIKSLREEALDIAASAAREMIMLYLKENNRDGNEDEEGQTDFSSLFKDLMKKFN